MGKMRHAGRLLSQFWKMAKKHKVWWMVPLILLLALVALLIVTSQAATPFIYTLF